MPAAPTTPAARTAATGTAPADRAAAASPWAVPVAAALAAACLAWHEADLRARGFRPSTNDSPALRAWVRAGANAPGAVVLAGSSRMQLGFDPATFRARGGGRPLVNVSHSGFSGAATLETLAADPGFAGTVLMGFDCQDMRPDRLAAARTRLAEERRCGPGARLAAWLHAQVSGRLAVLDAGPGWRRLTILWCNGHNPGPKKFCMRPDRSRPTDYRSRSSRRWASRTRAANVAARRAELPCDRADKRAWRDEVAPMRRWVKAIRRRGGRVVFVRFPTTGPWRRRDRKLHPRRHFWDRLARLTGAETVHYEDVPAMCGFDCPDTSHLDMRDAPRFTAGLLDELGRRGAL